VRVLAEDIVAERAVAVTQPLLQTQQAFDEVASRYHQANEQNRTLAAMRRRAWHAVDTFVPPGSHVLDLGCGPGSDAVRLARGGYRVTAIDWSRAMVEEAEQQVRAAGVADRVQVRHIGIHELHKLEAGDTLFDAAYSNFGPLNCIEDLAAAARLVAERLRPGGALVASVIGRVCPWELALYLSRAEWARARVRFRRGLVPVPLEGLTVWTTYYTPRAFARIFGAAGFERVSLRALGLFAPPPYLEEFADRHPRLVGALHRVDDYVGHWPGLRACGDHFLIVLRKA
jgi:2-polyprenyl-3-methyl-5-hydroxy-6-metoxy-1,4-benzoquinol methylase